jgi:hypothetical protein
MPLAVEVDHQGPQGGEDDLLLEAQEAVDLAVPFEETVALPELVLLVVGFESRQQSAEFFDLSVFQVSSPR